MQKVPDGSTPVCVTTMKEELFFSNINLPIMQISYPNKGKYNLI